MDQELFELCKDVYIRTGWVKTHQLLVRTDQGVSSWHNYGEFEVGNMDSAYPLYTSDYLLEKLPKNVTSFYGNAYPLSPQVMASGDMYYAMYKHDMTGPRSAETIFEVEADTPLKSLLKLTIALHEAGELS